MQFEIKEEQTQILCTPYKFASIPYRQVQIYCRTGKQDDYIKCSVGSKNRKINKIAQSERSARKKGPKCVDQYYVKPQKKFRNVVSNLIHHFVRHLGSEKEKYVQIMLQIASRYGLQINVQQIYEKLQNLIRKMKNYITIEIMKQFWFSEKEVEFCLVMRILGRYFYKTNGFLSIYFSNKICQQSKGVHYKCLKMLQEALVAKSSTHLRRQLNQFQDQ